MNRNLNLILVRKHHPDWTLQKIGDVFSISRERVRQILEKYGAKTSHISFLRVCKNCGKEISKNNKKSLCQSCKVSENIATLTCFWCGNDFERTKSQVRPELLNAFRKTVQTKFFCSKTCQGKWLGCTYGMGSLNKTELQKNCTTKEFCLRGHSLKDSANLYFHRGTKFCRQCSSIRSKISYYKRKEQNGILSCVQTFGSNS